MAKGAEKFALTIGLRDKLPLHFLGPTPLSRITWQNLITAYGLHMELSMYSQPCLHSQIVNGEDVRYQNKNEKVGFRERLRRTEPDR